MHLMYDQEHILAQLYLWHTLLVCGDVEQRFEKDLHHTSQRFLKPDRHMGANMGSTSPLNSSCLLGK